MGDASELPELRRARSRDAYRIVKQISKGSYGDVFLAERTSDDVKVCLKQVDLDFLSPSERLGCLSEVRLLQSLPSHPNVVSCYDAFWEVTSDCSGSARIVIVLEYGDAGDLESFIHNEYQHQRLLPVDTVMQIFSQIVSGLAFLHQQHILHRDIKSKNIFRFSNGRVVIGDFGTSKSLTHTAELTNTLVGSPLYMSPELLDDQPYSFASDVWSLGCLLYELFSGVTPFAAASYPAVVFKITKGAFASLPSTVPEHIRRLVARMLSLEPSLRPTVGELLGSEVLLNGPRSDATPDDSTIDNEAWDERSVLPYGEEDMINKSREVQQATESHEVTPLLLPPPPPLPIDMAASQDSVAHLPPPPPPPPLPASKAMHQAKVRRSMSPVLPTARASIARILSTERLHIHREKVQQAAKSSDNRSTFLSCVPVMDTGLHHAQPGHVQPRKRALLGATAAIPANPRAAVPTDNMLIIGTKVRSIKSASGKGGKR